MTEPLSIELANTLEGGPNGVTDALDDRWGADARPLRDAIHALFEAAIAGADPDQRAVAIVNQAPRGVSLVWRLGKTPRLTASSSPWPRRRRSASSPAPTESSCAAARLRPASACSWPTIRAASTARRLAGRGSGPRACGNAAPGVAGPEPPPRPRGVRHTGGIDHDRLACAPVCAITWTRKRSWWPGVARICVPTRHKSWPPLSPPVIDSVRACCVRSPGRCAADYSTATRSTTKTSVSPAFTGPDPWSP